MKYPFFKNIYIVGFFIISSVLIISCDKIKEPYKSFSTDIITNKKIILEEVTGHKCVNCPAAHKELQRMSKLYGHKIIGIAIHTTTFANPDGTGDYTADYRTTEGTKIATDYGASFAPVGFINRTKYNNKYLQGKDDWAAIVDQVLKNEKAPAKIEISNTYSNNDSTINTIINGTFLTKLNGNFKLCVLITEDSIISPQKSNEDGVANGFYPAYAHMHMLRKYMSDIYGDIVAINQVDSADTFNKKYQLKINKNWKAKNCKIVAFITKEDTKEIIQAEEKHFIEIK